MGDKVRKIVFDLVVDKITISQFQKLIQDVTTFPVRSFMLPFLHTQIPLLRDIVAKQAALAGCSPLAYLTDQEAVILGQEDPSSPPTDKMMEHQAQARKRKSSSVSDTGCSAQKKSPQQVSPPLFPSAPGGRSQNIVYPHTWNPEAGKLGIISGISYGPTTASQEGRSTEEEWKNVQVMLTCILGMVEKTQRAITILQQRQTTPPSVTNTEEIVEAVKDNASAAIIELKNAAMNEIKMAGGGSTEHSGEVCLNCGRAASDTCSGCNQARYCGAFCQQRDWDVGGHQQVCGGEERGERNEGDREISNAESPEDKSSNRKIDILIHLYSMFISSCILCISVT